MLSASIGSIVNDLRSYGEPDIAEWIVTCSDDDFVKICSVANWLLYNGPVKPSGNSMMIATACALAAVYVKEGAPRALSRSRRAKPIGNNPESWTQYLKRRPIYELQMQAPNDYAVGDDARAFWARSK